MSNLTVHELDQFTGTEQYYKHWLGILYTDGVKYVAEKAGAYWLIDVVASYQTKSRKERFQIWTLKVNHDNCAVLEMKEDVDESVLIKQEIPFTDFPLKEIQLFFIDNVLILPSEY